MCQNDSIDHICGYNDSQKAQMDPELEDSWHLCKSLNLYT